MGLCVHVLDEDGAAVWADPLVAPSRRFPPPENASKLWIGVVPLVTAGRKLAPLVVALLARPVRGFPLAASTLRRFLQNHASQISLVPSAKK